MASTSGRTAALLVGVAAAFACGDHSPTEPAGLAPDLAAAKVATAPQLVACPTSETRSVSGTFGILGGSLELDGTRIVVPVGAVILPTKITLTLPESRYMEVDFTANALDHFQFPVPVHVTIDYSRCASTALNAAPATAWYIDGSTKRLLERMTSRDDRDARRVSFTTIHFSGYSIAQ